MDSSFSDLPSYTRRVLIAAGIVAALAVALYMIQSVTQVLLLVLAGILLATFLTGIATYLHHRTPLPQGAALALVVIGLLMLFTGTIWLLGPRLSSQLNQLTERLPEAVNQIESTLQQHQWGQVVLARVPQPQQMLSSQSAGNVLGQIGGFFSTVLGALTNVLIVLIIGVYLAVNPSLYADGVVHLVPRGKNDRAREVLEALKHGLRWWLVGRLASMAVVGVLTALGLLIAGVPLAFTLGVISGVFSFVPYIGPIASAVPALLVALTESPALAGWVVIIYLAVQFLESYLITPLIQERAVSLPPALLVTAQLLMGIVAGILGVLLATPLTVAVIVLVQMLYVEDVLGDQVEVMGNEDEDV